MSLPEKSKHRGEITQNMVLRLPKNWNVIKASKCSKMFVVAVNLASVSQKVVSPIIKKHQQVLVNFNHPGKNSFTIY